MARRQEGSSNGSEKPYKPTARDRAELATATREVHRLRQTIAKSFYRLGKVLCRIRDRELWRAGGHDGFPAYLADEAGFTTQKSMRTAYRYMRIAEEYKEEKALALGITKLDLMLTHIDRTPEDEDASDIPHLELSIPTKDGKVVKKSVADATAREIIRATKAVNVRENRKALKKLPDADFAESVARRMIEALEHAHLGKTKVVVSRGKGEPKLGIHNMRAKNVLKTAEVIANALDEGRKKKKKK